MDIKSLLGNFNYLIINVLNLYNSLLDDHDSWKSPVRNRDFSMFFGSECRLYNIQSMISQIAELTKYNFPTRSYI